LKKACGSGGRNLGGETWKCTRSQAKEVTLNDSNIVTRGHRETRSGYLGRPLAKTLGEEEKNKGFPTGRTKAKQ